MNNIEKITIQKKAELKEMVDRFNQTHKAQQDLNNQILTKNGEVKQLNELLDETKKGK